jgi:hypothetical protein
MKTNSVFRQITFAFLFTLATSLVVCAAAAPNLTGEYADKKFLSGQAVFQLSLEQNGNTVNIFLSAGYNDGHGTAPEVTCAGKVNAKGIVEFKFDDSDGNSGSGTITPAGNDVIVSIKATKVRDPRGLVFYRDGIRLARQKK